MQARTLVVSILLLGTAFAGVLVATPLASACADPGDGTPPACAPRCIIGNICVGGCPRCPAPAASGSIPSCVVVVDYPDAGFAVCVHPADRSCPISETRTTFAGTETQCVGVGP